MATMITEVYDAFIAAGTPEVKARLAAEAIANYQEDIKEIKFKLNFLLVLIIPMFLAVFAKFLISILN